MTNFCGSVLGYSRARLHHVVSTKLANVAEHSSEAVVRSISTMLVPGSRASRNCSAWTKNAKIVEVDGAICGYNISPVKRYDSIGSAPEQEARARLRDSGPGTFD
jgi:hypothetical protein